jgi:hypothetical protein
VTDKILKLRGKRLKTGIEITEAEAVDKNKLRIEENIPIRVTATDEPNKYIVSDTSTGRDIMTFKTKQAEHEISIDPQNITRSNISTTLVNLITVPDSFTFNGDEKKISDKVVIVDVAENFDANPEEIAS